MENVTEKITIINNLAKAGADYPEIAKLMCETIAILSDDVMTELDKKPAMR